MKHVYQEFGLSHWVDGGAIYLKPRRSRFEVEDPNPVLDVLDLGCPSDVHGRLYICLELSDEISVGTVYLGS